MRTLTDQAAHRYIQRNALVPNHSTHAASRHRARSLRTSPATPLPLHRRTRKKLVDTATLTFGRTPRPTSPNSHRHNLLPRRRRRTLVDIAFGSHSGPDPLGDDTRDHHDTFTPLVPQPHLIPDPYGVRSLDPHPVHPHMTTPAGIGRDRTSLGEPHRPNPTVHPHTHHPTTLVSPHPQEPATAINNDNRDGPH